MWFLENAWLVPLIPAVSFVLILLFGKRLPRDGAEVGIAAVGASFVLSVGAAYQWINRVMDAEEPKATRASSARSARSAQRRPQHREARRRRRSTASRSSSRSSGTPPGSRTAGVKLGVGIQIDGLTVDDDVRRHADLTARARLLGRVHDAATAASRTSTPRSASSPRRCCCSSSPTTRCRCSSAGSSSACAPSC